MRRLTFSVCLAVVLGLALVQAQAPVQRPQPSPPSASASTSLPVRRIVLYKNGVGYFEHLGRVRGNQPITVDFSSAQLDDVLKSLTALDLGNGRVSGISYNSDTPFEQRLGALRLPVGGQTSMPQLLEALRGARVEVRDGGRVVTGRLLGIERRTVGAGATLSTQVELSIVSDGGEMRSVALTPAVSVQLAERDSVQQVGAYLGLLASTRAPDRRRMTIATAGTGERDVLVSYVSEVPIWKTNYRIVLARDAAPLLQGWAIVDNTTGEDWSNVELSLVAGAPQSFIEQISQPLYGRRPVVQQSPGAQFAPQTHEATLTVGAGSIRGTVRDPSGAVLPGVTVRALDPQQRTISQAVTDGSGGYTFGNLPAGQYTIEFALTGFQTVRLEGLQIAANATLARDAVMRVGSLEESVTVSGASPVLNRAQGGLVGGRGGGVPQAPAPAPLDRVAINARLQDAQAAAVAQELPDLFEYRVTDPVSIARNQSALVPIVSARPAIERVSLWNGRAGMQPLRALWITNSTGLTLDGGSFTVLDEGTFAGEGLVDPIKPDEKRLLSYAIDLGVQVESRLGDERRVLSRVIAQRGVVTAQREARSRRVYTIRNNDTTDRTLIIEHPVRAGWALVGGDAPVETSATAYRFRVAVPAKQTTTFTVDEKQPLTQTFQISSMTDDQINVIVRDSGANDQLRQALQPIIDKKASIDRLAAELAERQRAVQQMSEDEQRVRENLGALKGASGDRQLLKRYTDQLTADEDRIAALRREQADAERALAQARAELQQLMDRLAVDVAIPQ